MTQAHKGMWKGEVKEGGRVWQVLAFCLCLSALTSKQRRLLTANTCPLPEGSFFFLFFFLWPWRRPWLDSGQAGSAGELMCLEAALHQWQRGSWWINTPASLPPSYGQLEACLKRIPGFPSRPAPLSLTVHANTPYVGLPTTHTPAEPPTFPLPTHA